MKQRYLLLALAVIGPGIITSAVDNDASGIATYSIAGAEFGYSLIWTLIPITILLIVIQEMVARMGVVTGKGLADLIREEFGVKVTVLVMIGLFFANVTTTIAEFAGIVAAGEIFNISKFIIVPLVMVVIFLFVLRSSYRNVEKVFLVLIIFYAAYIISGLLAAPDWGEVARETVMPSIQWTSAYWVLLVAVIGTSVTPWMQFYLQSSVAEKGIRVEHMGITRWDVIIGSIVTSIIAFFIIVATGSTLHAQNIPLTDAKDVAIALEPLAGAAAKYVFGFGLFIAAFLGAWIVPLSTAYFITEGIGFESGINRKFSEAPHFYILLGIGLLISGVVILIPNLPLIPLIVFAQVVNALLLPLVFLLVLLLVNNKRIMKEHVNSRRYNIIAGMCLLGLVGMGVMLILTTFV